MDIFVTGATGVLGRPVVRLLVAAGHGVRGLCRSPDNATALRDLGAAPAQADLFDLPSLQAALPGCDAVLHLATHIPPTAQARRRAAWHEIDRIRREGTRTLVDAALATGVGAFIYPSVCFVYPDSGEAWIDAATAQPQSTASDILQSTLAAEAEVARFAGAGRRGIVLRMGNFYGPQAPSAQDVIRLARLGVAAILGPDDAYYPTIWVDDAAQAVVAALEQVPSGTYDVVDDLPLPRRDVIAAIAASVGHRQLLHPPAAVGRMAGGAAAEILSRSHRVSNRRFKDATGWAPTVPDARAGWALLAQGDVQGGAG
jgi:nucleoside-diphosphate-sugar epimerase